MAGDGGRWREVHLVGEDDIIPPCHAAAEDACEGRVGGKVRGKDGGRQGERHGGRHREMWGDVGRCGEMWGDDLRTRPP